MPQWPKPQSGDAMLTVGNVYGHGFHAAKLSEIERLGFAIRPQVSHYAGSQILRFIDFERGPPLELIEVANENEYRDFVPKGMEPYCPGISLVLPKKSERGLADFSEDFADLRPYALHVNYDGTADPGKPGWNYLNFEVSVVPGVFIWLTQLDEPRPTRSPPASHPNGALGILGLVLDVSPRELGTLSRLVGARPVHGTLDIGGLRIWTRSALADGPPIRGKAFPLRAVVLEASCLDGFRRRLEDGETTSFLSHPAVHLRTNNLSWDLLILAT